jgi:hypothetical protein
MDENRGLFRSIGETDDVTLVINIVLTVIAMTITFVFLNRNMERVKAIYERLAK